MFVDHKVGTPLLPSEEDLLGTKLQPTTGSKKKQEKETLSRGFTYYAYTQPAETRANSEPLE